MFTVADGALMIYIFTVFGFKKSKTREPLCKAEIKVAHLQFEYFTTVRLENDPHPADLRQ